MPPVNRHEPTLERTRPSRSYRSWSSCGSSSDDAACLEHLWRQRYAPDGEHAVCPKCEQERVFRKYATKQGRQSWTCTGCGLHVHPTAGTIFAQVIDLAAPLVLRDVSDDQHSLRHLGQAARASDRRVLPHSMEDAYPHQGRADEGRRRDAPRATLRSMRYCSDGKPRKPHGYNRYVAPPGVNRRSEAAKLRERSRATVFAAVERGGRIKATVLPSRHGPALNRQIVRWVSPRVNHHHR